jgi:putative peptidoglycan lipid II flippase
LASILLTWLLPTLVFISVLGILFSSSVVGLMTPGWTEIPEKFSLTVTLNRIMFPYILLISVAALAMGILNAMGHFTAPAFAPVTLNIALTLSALLSWRLLADPVMGIAAGVLLGGVAQVLLQIPPLWRRGFRYRPLLDPGDRRLKQVGRLFFPSLFGSTVYQVNMVVITVLASLLPEGSQSYLFYADRLMEFPLGVFAIAMGTVALPAMSRQAARGDLEGLQETLGFAFRQVSLVMIPATVGLVVLREPLISVIFQRGRFDPEATRMTAQALLFYSLGLWSVAQIRVVAPAFYALKDTVAPMKAAVLAIAANVLLSLLLMIPLQHAGLALAISVAAAFQLAILLAWLSPRLGGLRPALLAASLGKVVLAAAAMGVVCGILASFMDWTGGGPFVHKVLLLGATILAGLITYGLSLHLTGVEDLKHLVGALARRPEGRTP